jgi:hypothetical protein
MVYRDDIENLRSREAALECELEVVRSLRRQMERRLDSAQATSPSTRRVLTGVVAAAMAGIAAAALILGSQPNGSLAPRQGRNLVVQSLERNLQVSPLGYGASPNRGVCAFPRCKPGDPLCSGDTGGARLISSTPAWRRRP